MLSWAQWQATLACQSKGASVTCLLGTVWRYVLTGGSDGWRLLTATSHSG